MMSPSSGRTRSLPCFMDVSFETLGKPPPASTGHAVSVPSVRESAAHGVVGQVEGHGVVGGEVLKRAAGHVGRWKNTSWSSGGPPATLVVTVDLCASLASMAVMK